MRKNIRLKNYDYSSDGYYFVTIDTDYMRPYLQGDIRNIVVAELARLNTFEGVKVDYSIIMSNYIHLIIIFAGNKYSLFEIIRQFKSKTTVFAKKYAPTAMSGQLQRLWQPGYYEHIIRNEKALFRIREYIQNNPATEKINFEQFYDVLSTIPPCN